MNTEAIFWKRYQLLRDRARSIRDQVDIAGNDLEAMARTLPSDSYPETDLKAVVSELDELAARAHEVLASARAKHENGIAADKRIDALIAGTVQ